MFSKINSLTLLTLATTTLAVFPNQSSFAFTITNPVSPIPSRSYVNSDLGIGITVSLDAWPVYDPRRFGNTGRVLEVKSGGTDKLLSLLQSGWSDWTFLTTGQLSDEAIFDIQSFYPCTPDFPPPDGQCGIRNGGVGAVFSLDYYPGADDPSGDNIHWIQRIYSTTGSRGIKDVIDFFNYENRGDNPFYDDGGTAGPDYFSDAPWKRYLYRNHFFYAETYLVEEIAPQTVKIYNGVRWGWENKINRVPCDCEEFSDSLEAGETDTFRLSNLNVGSQYLAWIDNDRPENSCNPNTILEDWNSGNYDENSSFLGDGFASAFIGEVSSDGTIELAVSANGGRGEDRGNYDLYVKVYEPDEAPDPEILELGGSGGGGISSSPIGRTQDNPILPNETDGDWQIFRNVPSCQWYDPHTPYGFEFQTLDDTLFTEIVDFPVGADDFFTVAVEGTILGEFGAGDSLNFIDLLGEGVDKFTITDIDSLFGSTPETAFPIRLAFDGNRGSFQMRPFSKPVPEPASIFGLFALTVLGWFGIKQDS